MYKIFFIYLLSDQNRTHVCGIIPKKKKTKIENKNREGREESYQLFDY